MLNRDLDKVIEDYSEAIRLNPHDAEAYYRRGLKRQAKGDVKGAIADYNEAIRLNPRHAGAYCGRGMAYESKREFARANTDYRRCIQWGGNAARGMQRRIEVNEQRLRGKP